MSKENKNRTGIDERPLTGEEFERLRAGQALYERITAPQRPREDEQYQQNRAEIAV